MDILKSKSSLYKNKVINQVFHSLIHTFSTKHLVISQLNRTFVAEIYILI